MKPILKLVWAQRRRQPLSRADWSAITLERMRTIDLVPHAATVGMRVRVARVLRGLSQEHLGLLIGRSARSVMKIERGECYPGVETLVRLTATLRIEVGALLAPPEGGEL